MANAQVPLLFFAPLPNTDSLSIAQSLVAGSAIADVAPLDPGRLLHVLKAKRGFSCLQISLPAFGFDDPRAEAALEGTASETHIDVHFYGNFEALAERVFGVLVAERLTCYSVWDKQLITSWPKWDELEIDKGFGARMARIVQREETKLRETEPDADRRSKLRDTFLRSPEFRAQMAKEGRLEEPNPDRRKKTYSDYVNCYARWTDGHPSTLELAAVRKLNAKYAGMSVVELRSMIGNAPRLVLLTGAHPREAAMLESAAVQHGLRLDIEPP